jgi:hypothetical protein
MEEELEKLYQDLLKNRQIYRGQGLVQARPPHDFASLYPSVQKKYYYKIRMKAAIRKRKITNIFQ